MEVTEGLASLFVIVGVAALAPFIVAMLPGPKIPEVAVLLVLGVVIGPQVLGLATVSDPIALFSDVGLGFLFFVAGLELPPALLRGPLAKRAGLNWLTAVSLALIAAGILHWTGLVRDTVAVAIALTSTALGVLLPILRDAGIAERPLGRAVLANGAAGEFGPILAISLLLGSRGALTSLIVLAAFGAVALLLAVLPPRFGPRFTEILLRGRETTSQTSLRLIVLLLIGLLALAAAFGLDVILGAFFAGMITRRQVSPGTDERLEAKVDGMAFGLFVPLFFVVSGMSLDVQALLESPGRLALFFALLVVCRGLPTLLWFRGWLPRPDLLRLALYTATGLPIIVAVTTVGVESGLMLPANAAALVGAGVLSVLLFPAAAHVIGARHAVDVSGAPTRGRVAEPGA